MLGKFLLLGFVCAGFASGQTSNHANGAAAAPMAFEVVSIRQNVAGGTTTAFGATPDGFRMVNMTLGRLILEAYVPRTGGAMYWEFVGSPGWLSKDHWDIEARVAEADRADWQKPAKQTAMLRAMLQTMLAERCKLLVHREMKDAPVYYLEIGKGALKVKESNGDESYPAAQRSQFPGGGVVVPEGGLMQFYGAPMTLLASFLSNRNLDGPEIQDKTGLTGRYDFAVEWGAWTGGVGGVGDATDPGPTLFSAVGALGLKLVAAKGQVETLVVDHIERPSEN
jgi:uncharacterized protein (TIGR03435 family)